MFRRKQIGNKKKLTKKEQDEHELNEKQFIINYLQKDEIKKITIVKQRFTSGDFEHIALVTVNKYNTKGD